MRVVIKEPLKKPYVKEIEDELKAYRSIVGGYIECIYPFADIPIIMICDEEGKLKGYPPNFQIESEFLGYDLIVGTVIFLRSDREEFAPIQDKDIKFIDNYMKDHMVYGEM